MVHQNQALRGSWKLPCLPKSYVEQMSRSPGLYFDIGKKATDLLYKDYGQQPPVYFHYQSLDWNFDVSCETPDILPGLTTVFRFLIPDSSKVEMRMLHDYVGIAAGVGLKAYKIGPYRGYGYKPVVNLSGVVGSNLFSLGTDVAFDISARTFDKFNAGFCFNGSFLNAALTLNDQLDTIRASCYLEFSPLTKTAIAAELKHSFSVNEGTTVTAGIQHALFPFTLLKARVDSDMKASAVFHQGFWQKFLLAISGEVEVRNSEPKISRVGIAIALSP